MNIERIGSMKSFDALDANPSDNQNVQPLPNPAQLSRNSIQPQQQFLQVIQKTQMPFGNQSDFQQVLKQMLAQRQLQPQYIPSIKKRQSKVQQKQVRPQQLKKQRLLAIVEPYVKNYKALNIPNSTDSEVGRLRAQFRQKTFRFLLYGIQQLKLFKLEQLNEEEKRLTKLESKDPYVLAKSLTTQIDLQFLKHVNADNKRTASKKYRGFLKNFNLNISQQSNSQLRRRILSKQLTAKKMATMEQQQFYPDHIRQKMLQRQSLLLREAQLNTRPQPVISEDAGIVYDYSYDKPIQAYQQKKQEKPKYKYMQVSSLTMLRDFLKPEQIQKMKKTLQSDLRKDIESRLLGNFERVFETNI